jgi:anhydro-N-acetylmuramic acid kinase
MVYRAIGLMSGSSLDGLDIAFVQLNEQGGRWGHEIIHAACYEYSTEWVQKLKSAVHLNALDYQLLHTEYGHYLGEQVNRFLEENHLQYQVQLIASHGHTTFHRPEKKMTAQLGDGAAIAAVTGINVISDLRAMDIALGGQGAPIVPIGEKILFNDYDFFLNIGGIANISFKENENFTAFDICPANSILNKLASEKGKEFDENGALATNGKINEGLLQQLNGQGYYSHAYPKSLANSFGNDIIYPIIKQSGCSIEDSLRTYVEHVSFQIKKSIENFPPFHANTPQSHTPQFKLLSTGGGTLNGFLMERIKTMLQSLKVELVIPNEQLIKYKEALIMALIGVLRWRDENNVLASVTGAKRNSIGGAVWMGMEA